MKLTQSLRGDAAFGAWIHDPVVVFERVNGLQDGANAAHIAVDLRITQEFSC